MAFADRLPVGYAKLKLNSQTEFITDKNICSQRFLIIENWITVTKRLIKKTKEKNFNKIWLSVFINNNRAINFYSNTRFRPIGNHDFQIGKDNFEFIAMVKQL